MPKDTEMKLWQVRLQSGQGEQRYAASEKEARAAVAKQYGDDYAETITELFEIV